MRNDALLAEYQVLQKFRLEWSMMGHRWGYYLVPLCGTILWITWNFSRANLFVGILMTLALLCFWRYLHHYYDDSIKKLYPRIVEIEEEMNMRFTRRYLTKHMEKSRLFNENFEKGQLVTSDYILKYEDFRIFGSRGLEKWDLVSGIVIFLLCLWFAQIGLPEYLISGLPEYPFPILVFIIPIAYAFYFYRKDKQD